MMMESKKWYQSRTLWTNIIAVFAVPIAVKFGIEITAEDSVAILALINLLLRIITKQPLS